MRVIGGSFIGLQIGEYFEVFLRSAEVLYLLITRLEQGVLSTAVGFLQYGEALLDVQSHRPFQGNFLI